jgi:hypothetical protein
LDGGFSASSETLCNPEQEDVRASLVPYCDDGVGIPTHLSLTDTEKRDLIEYLKSL